MLHPARQLTASFHAELYKLVPEDHLLRKIHAAVDFGFIHEIVEQSYCKYYGRPANEPELLFRLLFLQILYNLSDERIIQETQVNLAYKWFIGINPEDSLPDASHLSRFRNHRLGASQVEDVLKHVVSQCIEQSLVKSKAIILDATHTQASSQNQKPLDVLRDAAKRLFRVVTKRHPKLEKKLPKLPHVKSEQADAAPIMLAYLALLGETVEELLPDHEGAVSEKLGIAKQIIEDERLLSHKGILSAIDPDARFGWKSSLKSFFGYKEHIAMTEEEIITALEVTPGSTDDGKQLPVLLEQTTTNGVNVNEIIADKAYSGKDNLAKMKTETITLYRCIPSSMKEASVRKVLSTIRMLTSSFARPASAVNARRSKAARPAEPAVHSCFTLMSRSARAVRCVMDATSPAPRARHTRFAFSRNTSRNRSSSSLVIHSKNGSGAGRSLNIRMRN